jgi:hypothetical protein
VDGVWPELIAPKETDSLCPFTTLFSCSSVLVQAWASKESSSKKEKIGVNTRAMQCKKEDDVSVRR